MSILLTGDELAELTQRQRASKQREVLLQLAIPFKIRPDGSLVVLRAAMEAALGHHAQANHKPSSPAVRVREARGLLSGQAR